MEGFSRSFPSEPARPGSPRDDEDDTALPIVERGMSGLRLSVGGLLLLTLPISERVLGFHVRYELAVPAMALVVAANVLLLRRDEPSPRVLLFGLLLDLLGIFAVLACSGGAANPWSALFLVHVALAAAILPRRTTLVLSAFAACLFLALFAVPSGACCPEHPRNGAFSTHLYGMWIAFAVSAAIIATFVTRVRAALEARGREITKLRREALENAKFRALATLAAGTAHELNTPLGTIAVLSGEIADAAEKDFTKAQAVAISAQVERCRQVITKLQAGGKEPRSGQRAALAPAVLRAVSAWRAAHPDAVLSAEVSCEGSIAARVSEEDVEAAVGALLDNAWFASRAAGSRDGISVSVLRDECGPLRVVVEDHGTGIAEELRDRLGEPFSTTKEPGEGMGLGLWLVRRAVEGAGGSLLVERALPRGTRVTMKLAEAES